VPNAAGWNYPKQSRRLNFGSCCFQDRPERSKLGRQATCRADSPRFLCINWKPKRPELAVIGAFAAQNARFRDAHSHLMSHSVTLLVLVAVSRFCRGSWLGSNWPDALTARRVNRGAPPGQRKLQTAAPEPSWVSSPSTKRTTRPRLRRLS
jgi:hypothetical protein